MSNLNKLSSAKIKNIKPGEKEITLSDGGNLYLRIRPNGNKNWMFIYNHPITKTRRKMGLGSYPALGLADARNIATEYRSKLVLQIDPTFWREEQKVKEQRKHRLTFKSVSEEWLAKWRKEEDIKREQKVKEAQEHAERHGFELDDEDIEKIRNKRRSSDDASSRLKNYLYPQFSNLPLDQLEAVMIIDALRPVEAAGKYETVYRVWTMR